MKLFFYIFWRKTLSSSVGVSCLAFNEVLKALRRKFQQITGEAFLPQIVREGGFNLADLPMAGRQVHWNGG